jgi:hypothetical protein
MRYLLAILIALHASFDSSTTAVVSWEQPADEPGLTITCLVRYYGAEYGAGVCWNDLEEGTRVVRLPGALVHPAYRPSLGDVYSLQINGVEVGRTTLGEVPSVYTLYLPLATQQTARDVPPVYLPAALR